MQNFEFKDLNLTPETFKALDELGFANATEIQYKSIPVIKQGVDVIGRSQTGTGKTLAFGIPCIENIDVNQKGVQALILCPTRELATQACEEFKKIYKFNKGIKAADIYGGAPMEKQITKLKTANIVIGTPGRVMDHMRRKTLKLDNLKMIVLDEADEMLSMGFREDIETILKEAPENRQTILFSATMPPEILAITEKFQNEPQIVSVNKKQVTVENIQQCYFNVPKVRKTDALNMILKYYMPKLCMIFCNTKRCVDEISEYLMNHGLNVQSLHGDMKQSQRNKVMESFKKGLANILVATDVAARGIDVNNIDYVINYDIPQNTEYYVHRIGRTGRAGKTGKAFTICCGRRQEDIIKQLSRLIKAEIRSEKMPSVKEIHDQKLGRDLNKLRERIPNDHSTFKDMLETLVKEGFIIEDIALTLMHMQFSVNEIKMEDIKAIAPKSNSIARPINGYKKIIINIGRNKRVAPNHIVAAISGSTNLPGSSIGKIEIFENKTIVSVPKDEIENVLTSMKNCRICGNETETKLHQEKENFSYKPNFQNRRNKPRNKN